MVRYCQNHNRCPESHFSDSLHATHTHSTATRALTNERTRLNKLNQLKTLTRAGWLCAFLPYVTNQSPHVVRPGTKLLSLIMVDYVARETDVIPEPNFDLSPRAKRIVYWILGTIIVCVAIFLTYQVIKTKIEKNAARRAQDLKDEQKTSRVDKYRQNQADETMGTIARINKALEEHERKMSRVSDMVTDIARNLNIYQVRELQKKIDEIANSRTLTMDEIQEMIDEMKKRTPRAIKKLEEARDLLTDLVKEKGELTRQYEKDDEADPATVGSSTSSTSTSSSSKTMSSTTPSTSTSSSSTTSSTTPSTSSSPTTSSLSPSSTASSPPPTSSALDTDKTNTQPVQPVDGDSNRL